MRMTISLCMIVKNEEQVLARCLDSVRSCVDEIIIADTGSTDRTGEIARKYTDKVYPFSWRDDFSAARNFSFSKATMDYILWLDADDILTPENARLLRKLKAAPPPADIVMMKYHTAFDEDDNPIFSYYRERLIRRALRPVWRGRVHEALELKGSIFYSDIAVTHRSVKTAYSDRNLRIYERQIDDGDPLSPRDQFYYGRELYYHGQYERAEDVLTHFLKSGQGWVENCIEACRFLSYCRTALGNPDGALRALTETFQYTAPRAEVCCEIGNHFMEQEEYQTAVFWYETARTRPRREENGGFICEDCYGFLPCIQLCVCYDRLGDHEKAEFYNALAGSFRPHAPAYLYNLRYFAQHPSSPAAKKTDGAQQEQARNILI